MGTPTKNDEKEVKDTLAYIRETMETAAGFTPISGWGLVVVGFLGIAATIAAYLGSATPDPRIWVPTAVLSIVVSAFATARKCKKLNIPLWSGSFQKLVWVMTPALLAGALLTLALADVGRGRLIPGTWLALYGSGVTAGGTHAAPAFRWMGIGFLVLGSIALFHPQLNIWLLGGGFGGLHIIFGIYLARKYGG